MNEQDLKLILELIKLCDDRWTGNKTKFKKSVEELKEKVERRLMIEGCLNNNKTL